MNDDLARQWHSTPRLWMEPGKHLRSYSPWLPFFTPPDYYAEMVKTNSHMLKIKGKLLEEKKIEKAEERKKAREAKKITKEV